MLVQLHAYAGFPRGLNVINNFETVLTERKKKGIKDDIGTLVKKSSVVEAPNSPSVCWFTSFQTIPPIKTPMLLGCSFKYATKSFTPSLFSRSVSSLRPEKSSSQIEVVVWLKIWWKLLSFRRRVSAMFADCRYFFGVTSVEMTRIPSTSSTSLRKAW